MFLVRMFLSILCFPMATFAIEIDSFSTGEGSTILLRHNGEAIMIDAGSSESKFRALYHSKSVKEENSYTLTAPQPQETNSIGSKSLHLRESSFQDDSSQSGSSMAHSDNVDNIKLFQEKTRKNYMEDVLQSIKAKLPCVKKKYFLKTLVITHADEDHYNLISKIFDHSSEFLIENVILSGFKEDYSETFRTWLKLYQEMALRSRSIENVIFTGMYNGEGGKQMGEGENGYARAYYSGMPGQTKTEKRIEEALTFSSNNKEDASNTPKLKILSMNAGHTMHSDSDLIYISNETQNSNSLVLRLEASGQSFLFTGDAENATWNHIRANFWKKEGQLQTDYLLLSHHGSEQGGATRQDILDLIKPKVCFVSVGRHLGYHHPRQNVLDIIKSLPSLLQTETHIVSYFGRENIRDKFSHKRRHTTQAIFSTLNHGTLSLTLQKLEGGQFPVIRTSSYMETICATIVGQKFSVDYDNVYCLENRNTTIEEGLAELRKDFEKRNIKDVFWRKEKNTDKIVPYTFVIQPNIVNSEEEAHVLVDEDNKRFYFLEKLEEDVGEEGENLKKTGETTNSDITKPARKKRKNNN